jgi:hypothetical protein
MTGAVAGLALAALPVPGTAPGTAHAQVAVELELVLAVDTSASVDATEFDLQMRGLATAFRDPGIVATIRRAAPGGIAVSLVQWGGPLSQRLSVGWAHVDDAASAERFAARVEAARRAYVVEPTAIAHALNFAMELFAENGFAGRRRVIDVSGDGPNNYGYHPDAMRDWAVNAGITVNGLAVLGEHDDLEPYYRDHVIGGPGAFLVRAADYGDFARAIRLKLMREIEGAPLALATPPQSPSSPTR